MEHYAFSTSINTTTVNILTNHSVYINCILGLNIQGTCLLDEAPDVLSSFYSQPPQGR